MRGGRQVVGQPRQQREGERRLVEEAAFQGGRHGAGIQHVVTQIGAQVDARHHHVGGVLEQAVEAQVHAVGRRTVDADEAVVQPLRMQRTVEGQRTAGPAAVGIGGDHHALGVIRQRLVQRNYPGGVHAVIVGDQYSHGVSTGPVGKRRTSSRTSTVAKQPAGRTNSSCRMSVAG
ncbi:hypothetical protein D3C78_1419310 [compost metagenome]